MQNKSRQLLVLEYLFLYLVDSAPHPTVTYSPTQLMTRLIFYFLQINFQIRASTNNVVCIGRQDKGASVVSLATATATAAIIANADDHMGRKSKPVQLR